MKQTLISLVVILVLFGLVSPLPAMAIYIPPTPSDDVKFDPHGHNWCSPLGTSQDATERLVRMEKAAGLDVVIVVNHGYYFGTKTWPNATEELRLESKYNIPIIKATEGGPGDKYHYIKYNFTSLKTGTYYTILAHNCWETYGTPTLTFDAVETNGLKICVANWKDYPQVHGSDYHGGKPYYAIPTPTCQSYGCQDSLIVKNKCISYADVGMPRALFNALPISERENLFIQAMQQDKIWCK